MSILVKLQLPRSQQHGSFMVEALVPHDSWKMFLPEEGSSREGFYASLLTLYSKARELPHELGNLSPLHQNGGVEKILNGFEFEVTGSLIPDYEVGDTYPLTRYGVIPDIRHSVTVHFKRSYVPYDNSSNGHYVYTITVFSSTGLNGTLEELGKFEGVSPYHTVFEELLVVHVHVQTLGLDTLVFVDPDEWQSFLNAANSACEFIYYDRKDDAFYEMFFAKNTVGSTSYITISTHNDGLVRFRESKATEYISVK